MEMLRQQDLFDGAALANKRVLLVGAGGIGSVVAMCLSKMGITQMQVWDKDCVEAHNVPNQFYRERQEGEVKVHALQRNVLEFSGCYIEDRNAWWEGDFSFEPDVVITAVDSMLVRNKLAPNIKAYLEAKPHALLIDCRMSAGSMSLYLATKATWEAYEEQALFPDSEAMQEPCTAKAIIFTPFACAYAVGHVLYREVRGLPVYTSYHGDLFHFGFTRAKGEVHGSK